MTTPPPRQDEPAAPSAPAEGAPADGQAQAGRSPLMQALRDVGPVVQIMLLASVTLPALVGFLVIGKSIGSGDELRDWVVQTGPLLAMVMFGAAFAVLTGSALAPTYAMSVACGVMFGAWSGGGVAVAGVVVGAAIGYAWGFWLARTRVMGVIDAHPRGALVRHALVDRTLPQETLAVGLLRLPPNSPFALTNIAMSSTGVRMAPFVIGTAIGMAPRTVFAAWLGHQTGSIVAALEKNKWHVVIGIAIGLVVLFILFRLASNWVSKALEAKFGPGGAGPASSM